MDGASQPQNTHVTTQRENGGQELRTWEVPGECWLPQFVRDSTDVWWVPAPTRHWVKSQPSSEDGH